ncbi:MAG: 50S ribosomal protein L15 [Candidatus Micrarchaeota archaeon]|nr:50S ribosomal protein L15 [Candidatus Micrarchaeota archaeon]
MASKKAQKRRGKRTHGYGSHKKHRGGGSRGGRGLTGAKAHKFVKFLKEKPGHIGKYGFTSKSSHEIKTINLSEIERLAVKMKKKEINVVDLGYDKVLGKGGMKVAITIHSPAFSEIAKRKIESAGGKAIVPTSGDADDASAK